MCPLSARNGIRQKLDFRFKIVRKLFHRLAKIHFGKLQIRVIVAIFGSRADMLDEG